MVRWGCYCGCRSHSNKARWVLVAAFFVAGLIAYGTAIAELAKCNQPCPGDPYRKANKKRIGGMPIYKCDSSTLGHRALQ